MATAAKEIVAYAKVKLPLLVPGKDPVTIEPGTRLHVISRLNNYVIYHCSEHGVSGSCKKTDLDMDFEILTLSDDSTSDSIEYKEFPSIEKARTDNDDMNDITALLEKTQISEEPMKAFDKKQSTPMPRRTSQVSKRKSADSTMISSNRAKRMSRNSLAFYKRAKKVTKKSKLRFSDPLRKTDVPPTIPENPFLKCLETSKICVDSDDSENDTSENDESSQAFGTFLPPSASAILQTAHDKLDKETEIALKFIRTHSDKVPKYDDYKTKRPLALFLCRNLYNFAIQQGLHTSSFVHRWLFYAFPESNQEKLHYYLQQTRLNFPDADLFTTLRELARVLSPDDFMSLQNIKPRMPSEGLTDLVIRLLADIPIVIDCTKAEIPQMVAQFIKNTEKQSPLGVEFRRELIRTKLTLTDGVLMDIASRVDRLIQPSAQIFDSINKIEKSENTTCVSCKRSHNHRRANGDLWKTCESCFYGAVAKEQQHNVLENPKSIGNKFTGYESTNHRAGSKPDLYSGPSKSAIIHRCIDCGSTVRTGPDRKPYSRCQSCYRQYRQSRYFPTRTNYTREFQNQKQPYRGSQSRNSRPSTYADATRPPRPRTSFRQTRVKNVQRPGQMIEVNVRNRLDSKQISGLLDTGCSDDVLTLKACRKLGIDHLIQPVSQYTSGPIQADGSQLKVVGTVSVDILVGKAPYQQKFTVLEHMPNHDIMIGTKFLDSKGILNQIYDVVGENLGYNNIRKGN